MIIVESGNGSLTSDKYLLLIWCIKNVKCKHFGKIIIEHFMRKKIKFHKFYKSKYFYLNGF